MIQKGVVMVKPRSLSALAALRPGVLADALDGVEGDQCAAFRPGFWGVFGLAALAAATLAAVVPARADIIDDPLHGQCNGSGGGACMDNGTNTPLGNSTSFSFSISPGPQTGDLVLEVLVPNNKTAPSPLQITETSPALVTLTATQHPGTWTSGNLDAFLGISASPNNP